MKERLFPAQSDEKGITRKVVDKLALGVSFITLPIGLYTAGTSLVAGEFLKAGLAGGFSFLDYTQIKEHGREREKQSWYNPERLMDRVLNLFRPNRGSARFSSELPSYRTALSAA